MLLGSHILARWWIACHRCMNVLRSLEVHLLRVALAVMVSASTEPECLDTSWVELTARSYLGGMSQPDEIALSPADGKKHGGHVKRRHDMVLDPCLNSTVAR